MSVLVVGLSHRSAPVDLLEQVSLDTDATVKLSHQALEVPAISEAAVISTCNRVEVYVEAERFHGSVEDLAQLLADQSGLHRDALLPHVYVHYDQAAVAHLFRVAAGLDSMILGESQILGQVREALHRAQAESTMGANLNALFQQALRIGKRGHAETGIDRLAPSIVTAALDTAGDVVSAPHPDRPRRRAVPHLGRQPHVPARLRAGGQPWRQRRALGVARRRAGGRRRARHLHRRHRVRLRP
jgi:glutamyl-tRNA reductase